MYTDMVKQDAKSRLYVQMTSDNQSSTYTTVTQKLQYTSYNTQQTGEQERL